MNKFAVKAWIRELRSGRYAQGQLALRNPNETYCCLGVICDVFAPERWTKRESMGWYVRSDSFDLNASLPPDISKEIGITSDGAFYVHFDGVDKVKLEEIFTRYPGAERAWFHAQDKMENEAQPVGIRGDDLDGKFLLALAQMNDGYGQDEEPFYFTEIADILDAALSMPEVFDFDTAYEEAFAHDMGK